VRKERMITYRTFSDHKWLVLTASDVHRKWEKVRQQAQDFVRDLDEEDVVAITESGVGTGGPYVMSVTVWYKAR
jgi:hypothetical protein